MTTNVKEAVCIKAPKDFKGDDFPHTVGKKYKCEFIESEGLYYIEGFFFKIEKSDISHHCPLFKNHFMPVNKNRKKKLREIEKNNEELKLKK